MRIRLLILSLLTILLSLTASAYRRPKNIHAALDSLDAALALQHDVVRERFIRIDTLKLLARKHPDKRLHYKKKVAEAYRGLNIDSAITYYVTILDELDAADHSEFATDVRLEYARQMAKAGQYAEALRLIDNMKIDSTSRRERIHHLDVRAQALIDGARSHPVPRMRHRHIHEAINALDTLSGMWRPHSVEKHLCDAQRLMFEGKRTLAEGEIMEIFDSITPDSPAFAVASTMLAEIYKNRNGRADEPVYYLALAALADAKSGNREAYALQRLGAELFRRGDYDHAYEYLATSAQAIQEVTPHDYIFDNSATARSLLESTNLNEHKRKLIFIIAIILLSLAFVIFSIMNALNIIKWKNLDRKIGILSRETTEKDKYINQLLRLCYSYHESLEEFNRLINRKLKVGQVHDVLSLTESGSIIQDQTKKFYDVFDQAILNIIPDFPTQVNNLLLPDKQIELPDAQHLSPELRIAAFMRLGVMDSNQISKFLGLSLNTVYTYRNRMKARAKNRETFENDILKIARFD